MLQVQLPWFAVIVALLMTQESLENVCRIPSFSCFPQLSFLFSLYCWEAVTHNQKNVSMMLDMQVLISQKAPISKTSIYTVAACFFFLLQSHVPHWFIVEMWQSRYIPHLKDRRGIPPKTQVEVKSQRKLTLNLTWPLFRWNSRQGIQTTRDSSKRKWHWEGSTYISSNQNKSHIYQTHIWNDFMHPLRRDLCYTPAIYSIF